jgi:hypothetical protein
LPGLENPHWTAAQNLEGAAFHARPTPGRFEARFDRRQRGTQYRSGDRRFYRRFIDLRSQVKEQLNTADPSDEADLDSQQQALKILANATSYGIFVELIVEELDATESRLCFGSGNDGFPVRVDKVETPGHYFHPLLATLITGAAHLMLAIA